MFLLIAGALLGALDLINVAIGLFAAVVLFQIVTLPVEFDASRRAAVQLKTLGIANPDESVGVRKVLTSAALTYVAGALAAIAQLGVLRHHVPRQPLSPRAVRRAAPARRGRP